MYLCTALQCSLKHSIPHYVIISLNQINGLSLIDPCALCSTLSTALTEGQPHIKSSLPDGHPQSTSETWPHITPPLSPYAPEKTEYLLSFPLFHALAMLSPQPRAPLCHLCVSKPTYPPGPVKSHLFPEAFPHPFIRVWLLPPESPRTQPHSVTSCHDNHHLWGGPNISSKGWHEALLMSLPLRAPRT